MFLTIPFIMDKILYTSATLVSIHNFVNVPLLGAILGDDRLWLGRFWVRKEEWVIWNVSFEEVCMKLGKVLGLFGSLRVYLEHSGNVWVMV